MGFARFLNGGSYGKGNILRGLTHLGIAPQAPQQAQKPQTQSVGTQTVPLIDVDVDFNINGRRRRDKRRPYKVNVM